MNIACTFSGMLKTPERKDAPLVVAKAGELAFQYCDDPLVMRARIEALQAQIEALPEEQQLEMPVEHDWLPGIYMRTIRIAKGTLLVGKRHKADCINIVAAGDITVVTETGHKRMQAGYKIVSPAGLKKVGYAHEDTVFINVFRTDLTDLDEIERELIGEEMKEIPL